MPSSFCRRDGGGCRQLRRRDCRPGRRRAAHDLAAHRGRCTALQARCEAGRHLLITDAQDSLVWSRDAQQGWAVGAYRDDAAEEPESFLHHQRLHHPSTAPARAAHPVFRAPTAGTGSGPLMSTEDTEAAAAVDAEEPIEVEDLLEDPRTDVEALCLCTLLWAN